MRLYFIPLILAACGGSSDPAPTAPAPAAPAPQAVPAPGTEPVSPAAINAPTGEVTVEADAGSDFDAAGTFTQACGPCHGAAGAGDGPAGAALPIKPTSFASADFWEGRDDASVAKIIKEGGAAVGKSPLMAPFGSQFDDAQIAALVAHIHTLQN
ncbi:MAG: cytochrome c [Myxococcota bacterium]|nr:cytochrome c [Myxococcota bacterium]